VTTKTADWLDGMLAHHFAPTDTPRALARHVMAAAARRGIEGAALVDGLAIEATPRGITRIRRGRQAPMDTAAARRLAERAREELREYLDGARAFFSVPVDLSAVPSFQRRVLDTARRIPFGEWRPYAWVAERIGHPRATRAVGTALGRNPVPLIVPCHRVARSDGGLGGYIFGLGMKERLLALERVTPLLEGCASTRIVCRVGCIHGRHMRPDHRVVFASVGDARSVGYRPCRVCRPDAA
jgi:O-6-methylguanine DNA methyltransferase